MSGEWTVIDRDRQRCREGLGQEQADHLVELLESEGHGYELIKPDGTRRVTEGKRQG